MRNVACVVLAASLIFPILVSRASPADEEPVTAPGRAMSGLETATGPLVGLLGADLPESFRLPEELESLPPEERDAALEKHLLGIYISYMSWRESWSDRPGGICLAAGTADADLCAAAARISHSRPCLAAADCPALEAWKEVMGTPGLRPAPRSMVRAAVRLPSVPEQD